jgi:WS/DGAT/MGAT family acyltransferase
MPHYSYERLSALDNSFLVFEDADHNTPMHVASVAIFDREPLTNLSGGIDIDRISAHIASRLHRIPRYRERLAYIPVEGHPVWVDDDCFNLNYHVRHTALPHPGSERQLKRLCARIMSQQLDRGKPLWETWIVEGLQQDRVAMICKAHHCMIYGVSGVDLLAVLLDDKAKTRTEESPPWIPRPMPSRRVLLRDEAVERLRAPSAFVSRFLRQPRRVLSEVGSGLGALAETARASFHFASGTPLNEPIGPHRRFDWTTTDMDAIREVRRRCGGTVNDVVLAAVTGAVRDFLKRRRVPLRDLDFRVFVPVNVRTKDERGRLGNRVAGWIVDLPVAESNPAKRFAVLRERTADLKQSNQARGVELLSGVADWTGTTLLTLATRLATQAHPANMVVTNVPGPPTPLYLLGARMLEAYPMVPLAMNMGLGVALLSNAGKLFWGFNADWDVIPDLHDFVLAVRGSFAELQGVSGERKAAKRANRRWSADTPVTASEAQRR